MHNTPMDYLQKLINNSKRDKKIIKRLLEGERQAEVARDLSMSRQLVNVIWKKYKNGTDRAGS
jgi:hypothetical protein